MGLDSAALVGYNNMALVPPRADHSVKGFNEKLYRACQDFEAVFINQMLDSVRATLNKNGLLDGGIGQNIYEDMLYQKYSVEMARTAHFGLARLLYKQLSSPAS